MKQERHNVCVESREGYVPWTVLPEAEDEADALRAWVCTHQSMFLTTGAATAALLVAMDRITAGALDDSLRFLRLAEMLRLASSVYTMLPTVDLPIYERYLRPAMRGASKGFSGVSSREAIAFANAVARLRALHKTLCDQPGGVSDEVLMTINECLKADNTWWDLHGNAMNRMVKNPVSLAQQEYKRRSAAGESTGSHSEFLAKELQTTIALDIYDRFFGCHRVMLSPADYLAELTFSLKMSDPFISSEEPFVSYRKMLTASLPELPSLVDAG